MKKQLSKLLVLTLFVTMMIGLSAVVASAETDYSGKTVILYSGNLRGDVDQYAKLAAAKKDFAAKGADVYLVDAGNYLQGTTYAQTDRGESIYNLMDAAGYDVAAMGVYEFSYGDATTGQKWHGNLKMYHTQAQLLWGAEETEYAKNGNGSVKDTLPAKAPANFAVISSNMTCPETDTYYAFTRVAFCEAARPDAISVGFAAQTDEKVKDMLQDGFLNGYDFAGSERPVADVVIGLSNDGKDMDVVDRTIQAQTDGEEVIGALIIDNATKAIEEQPLELTAEDAEVAAKVAEVKAAADPVVGTAKVTLNGADSVNWKEESNLGDLTADALLWYANNKFEGFEKDAPVVAVQNGGNCDQFLYTGDVTEKDILRSLPFSPFGISVTYLTGAQLEELLEAGTSPSERYGQEVCPGFAQVAGMTYNVDRSQAYDQGEAYGNFYKANSVKRVTITSVGGELFDPEKTYAVVMDNYLAEKYNDTYYVVKDAVDAGAKHISNGSSILVRDIVKMYIKEALGGAIGEEYAAPQGRITGTTYQDLQNDAALAAQLAAEAKATADASKAAAESAAKKPGPAAVDAAKKAAEDADAAKKAADNAKEAADRVLAAAQKIGDTDLIKAAQEKADDAAEAATLAQDAVDDAAKAVEAACGDAVKNAEAQKVTGLKAKALAKKKAKFTWKKNANVTGYQIVYSTSKKFAKAKTKTVNIAKAKTVKTTVSKLKAKKKYFVKIRPYTAVTDAAGAATNVYGKWSKAVKFTAKK